MFGLGKRVCLPSEDCKDFNLIGGEVMCASESVVSMPSSVSVARWKIGVAEVVLMRVGGGNNIICISKDWTT